MDWLTHLLTHRDATQSILVLCLTGALGMALARVKVAGISVGIAGVLFAGLLVGNMGVQLHPEVGAFAKELGLLLFVYTIGLELGPSFFNSLKRQGLQLNGLAVLVVAGGAATALALAAWMDWPVPLAVGLLTGATTNTPSLGAAQQALAQMPGASPELLRLPGVGYALAYPLGVVGIITSLLLTRVFFRIQVAQEVAQLKAEDKSRQAPPICRWNILVRNPNMQDLPLSDLPGLDKSGVVISRVLHDGQVTVALPSTRLHVGDVILAVGPEAGLESLRLVLGERADIDLGSMQGPVEARRVLVTRAEVTGKSLQSLKLTQDYGVNVTRIHRGGIDLSPQPDLALQMGDQLTVVGQSGDLDRLAPMVGNSPKALEHLNILPFFVGIALGVLVGAIPLALPGLPVPAKLGLAGGPLLVGMILSRLIRVGPFVWYMPPNANMLLREAGIILFLACVGLSAGPGLVEALRQGQGWAWMLGGAVITILPLALATFIGRKIMRLNYLTLCGALSGSMTDPPALAYVNSLADSNGASVAYATVYPLTMILRIIAAQVIILLF
jgi:putative transport protein